MNMEILNAILGIIFCGALLAIIYVLQKWNVKWMNALHLHITENDEAKEELIYIQDWPAMLYYYTTQESTGYTEVFAKYSTGIAVCIKHYTSDDAAFNKLCAEELVEKLNERI